MPAEVTMACLKRVIAFFFSYVSASVHDGQGPLSHQHINETNLITACGSTQGPPENHSTIVSYPNQELLKRHRTRCTSEKVHT